MDFPDDGVFRESFQHASAFRNDFGDLRVGGFPQLFEDDFLRHDVDVVRIFHAAQRIDDQRLCESQPEPEARHAPCFRQRLQDDEVRVFV